MKTCHGSSSRWRATGCGHSPAGLGEHHRNRRISCLPSQQKPAIFRSYFFIFLHNIHYRTLSPQHLVDHFQGFMLFTALLHNINKCGTVPNNEHEDAGLGTGAANRIGVAGKNHRCALLYSKRQKIFRNVLKKITLQKKRFYEY